MFKSIIDALFKKPQKETLKCYHCGLEIDSKNEPRKCPNCKSELRYRNDPETKKRICITPEKSKEVDEKWKKMHFFEKWVDRIMEFGVTTDDIRKVKTELENKGFNPSDGDILWDVFMKLNLAVKLKSPNKLSYLYFLKALFLYEEKRKGFEKELAMSNEINIKDDRKFCKGDNIKVIVPKNANPCDVCKKSIGVTYSYDTAMKIHFLPHKGCTCKINDDDPEGWCPCKYSFETRISA